MIENNLTKILFNLFEYLFIYYLKRQFDIIKNVEKINISIELD